MLQLAAPLESPTSTSGNPPDAPIKTLSELEKDYILQVLRKTNWNISGKGGAAELLGLNSSTLRGRMRKHDIRIWQPSYLTAIFNLSVIFDGLAPFLLHFIKLY
jgi:transcriptional regulator with GAF, ATPase, and Fis domain